MHEIKPHPITKTLSFNKENNLWYADLPEFLKQGLGTKANLLMVDGAYTFLEFLSANANRTTVPVSTEPFENHMFILKKIQIGLNKELLEAIGHAPVDYGAYYKVKSVQNADFEHILWLCPIAEYVFQGEYPQHIFISKK